MAVKDPKREDVGPTIVAGQESREGEGRLPPTVKERYEAYKAGKTKPISLEELFSDL
jgi:hypothetical protein